MAHSIARVFTGPDGRSHLGELQLAEHDTGEGHITRIVDAPVALVQIELDATHGAVGS